jgi:hypothetical protein
MPVQTKTNTITLLDGGLDTSTSSIDLDPKFTPNCQNVNFKDGVVEKRTGMIWDANSGWSHAPDTMILGFIQHQNYETTARKFFWAVALDVGADNKYDVQYFLYAANIPTWADGDVDNDDSLVTTYDYWMNWCQVVTDTATADGTPDGEFLITNVTPTHPGKAAGGMTPRWVRQGHATDYDVFEPLTYGVKCARVLFYNGHLLYMGVENASHMIKWTNQWQHDAAAPPHWFYTYDTGGAILNGELLKDTVACYKQDSIWLGTRLTADPYIRWSCMYPDVGLLAPRLLATWGNYHIFVGNNNIYIYAGGRELYPIGDRIWSSFIGDIRQGGPTTGGSTKLYQNRSFASVHRTTGDIAFWIPTGSSSWPNKAYVYNMFRKTWTTWTLPTSGTNPTLYLCVTGCGEYEADFYVKDGAFVPFYAAVQGSSASDAVAYPKVLKWNFASYTDPTPQATAGTHKAGIDAYWDSKDFVNTLEETNPTVNGSFEVMGMASGSTVTVSWSGDGGSTVAESTTSGALSTTDYSVVRGNFNRDNYKARMRVADATSGKGFKLRTAEIKTSQEQAE